MEYEPVIGLEVHCQLKTVSKLFCGCSTRFGASPNTQICPVCLGFPGALPVLNQQALSFAVQTGLMVGSQISTFSKFDRKNYFYPDLPKAYQISQYDKPICIGGVVQITVDGVKKDIHLTRIHLEEDAGKLVHFSEDSGVDYNRGGIPLIEIVSEPDLRSAREAYEYLRSLKTILLYLGVSDCNMEEGSLRCDANVSIRPTGRLEYGTKAEIKNLNSFHGVENAITYEIARQKEILSQGGRIVQETRLWNADEKLSRSMRSKEEAHDYRYFPEPDLVPVAIPQDEIDRIRKALPEHPRVRMDRFMKDYGLNEYDADVLTAQKALADYFEKGAPGTKNPKALSNWIMGDLSRDLNAKGIAIEQSPVSCEDLLGLVQLIDEGAISGKMAKDVFVEMFTQKKSAKEIVKSKGLTQVSDRGQIAEVIRKVLGENQKSVQDFLDGKKNAMSFLVGQVMKATQGKANPKIVNEVLQEEVGRLKT